MTVESILKVKRIFKETNDLTNQGRIYEVDSMIDFDYLSDYEEYKGDLAQEGKHYSIVLMEYNLTNEYKIIEMKFDDLHKIYREYKKSIGPLRRGLFN